MHNEITKYKNCIAEYILGFPHAQERGALR